MAIPPAQETADERRVVGPVVGADLQRVGLPAAEPGLRAARPDDFAIVRIAGRAGLRDRYPCSSATRSGTRCNGVPVMTSRPKPATRARIGIAAHFVRRLASGAEAT